MGAWNACGVARKVGAWFGHPCPSSPRGSANRHGLPSAPVNGLSFFFKGVKCLFFSFPSLLTLGPDVLANPRGMDIVAGHRLLLLS